MRTVWTLSVSLTLLTTAALAQPVVSAGGILNAASYALNGLPNSGIAQGSMFIVFGSGLGPATISQISSFPLPLSLAGTSMKVTVNNVSADVPMIYTLSSQVAGILPSNTPVGVATLTVTYKGQTSAPAVINVVKTAVGIFAVNQQGSGPGVLQNFVSETDLPVNTVFKPARPGQTIILWGVGLGPIKGDDGAGIFPGNLDVNTEVYVGSKLAPVTYKGRSGCCAGLDQIVFTVPADAPDGCHVPVVVKTADIVSNYVSMAISRNGNTCDAESAAVQQKGSVKFGQISLTRVITKASLAPIPGSFSFTSDSGSGIFGMYSADLYAQSQGNYEIGTCTSYSFKGQDYLGGADPVAPVLLDAGPALNMTGPKGTKKMDKGSNGTYAAQLAGAPLPTIPSAGPDYLDAGPYTVDNGSGGTGQNAVGPFTAKITFPAPLKWENQDAINDINRAQNLEVTWSGGDPNGFVNIVGGSATSSAGVAFVCREKVSAGRFTIPSAAMLNVPLGDLSVLSVGGISSVPFTANGIDAGVLTYYGNSARTVTFR
jgi:uncharacterized protein (TIGR03437 family)